MPSKQANVHRILKRSFSRIPVSFKMADVENVSHNWYFSHIFWVSYVTMWKKLLKSGMGRVTTISTNIKTCKQSYTA